MGKLKIEARFFGNELTFYRQSGRFENWETFDPSEEDWDALVELGRNKLQRGKVSSKHWKLIEARGKK